MLARTMKMGMRPRSMAPLARMMSGKADAAMDKNRIVNFKVYRFNPDESSEPHIQTYPVNMAECGKHTILPSAGACAQTPAPSAAHIPRHVCT